MDQYIVNEANRLKQLAGKNLEKLLTFKFNELVSQGFLKGVDGKTNFQHTGFSYRHQYKTNFILKTLDDKYVIINTSQSFRDRVKQDLYDFQGIMQHASISKNIIASVLLYPDEEFERNSTLRNFQRMVEQKEAYCPATHILSFSGLIKFLESHKESVEIEQAESEVVPVVINGSYAGRKGNEFESEVVRVLCSKLQLDLLKSNSPDTDNIYKAIVSKLSIDYNFNVNEIISIDATNTVKKLASGGNAKTDVIVIISTIHETLIETMSIKNTTKNVVSCHDYRADDFIRVLNISKHKLADYFIYYQQFGAIKDFEDGLPYGYSSDDFSELLKPYRDLFIQWTLTGAFDEKNLIDPKTQISNYLLINKSGTIRFVDFTSYIKELDESCHYTFGVPLRWTYPSKQRGSRIQLKLPICI